MKNWMTKAMRIFPRTIAGVLPFAAICSIADPTVSPPDMPTIGEAGETNPGNSLTISSPPPKFEHGLRTTIGSIELTFDIVGTEAVVTRVHVIPVDPEAEPEDCPLPFAIPQTLGGYPVGRIGEHAFEYDGIDDDRIRSVEIPNGVKDIGEEAFSYCYGLLSVSIPDSVTNIAARAFADSALLAIEIPGSVKTIGESAFRDCSGFCYLKIGDGVADIGAGAFEGCHGLQALMLPDSITNIGTRAFADCRELVYAEIGNGIKSIANGVFDGCRRMKCLLLGDGVRTIADGAFRGCSYLESISLGGGIEHLDLTCFADSRIARLVIPDSVTNIAEISSVNFPYLSCLWLPPAFKGKTDGLGIPNSCEVRFLGDEEGDREYRYWLGRNRPVLVERLVERVNGVTWWYEIINGKAVVKGAYPEYGAVKVPATLGGCRVSRIDDGCFAVFWTQLYAVKISESVEEIGDSLFCEDLLVLEIPDSVSSIGRQEAFALGSNLVYLSIGSGLRENAVRKFTIDRDQCTRLKTVVYGNQLAEEKFPVRGYAHFSTTTSYRRFGNGVKSMGRGVISIPNGVTSIEDRAFADWDWEDIEGVIMPDGLRNIGAEAFMGCPLTWMAIPNSVTNIGKRAFSGCGFYSVSIPNSVTSIGEGAFSSCCDLYWVSIPNSVTNLGHGVFHYCFDIYRVTLPECFVRNVNAGEEDCGRSAYGSRFDEIFPHTYIHSLAFANGMESLPAWRSVLDIFQAEAVTDSLVGLYLPASMTNVNWSVFSAFPSFGSVSINNDNPAYRCEWLDDAVYSRDMKTLWRLIPDWNDEFTIPNGVEKIGPYAFSGLPISSVVLPETMKHICENAFAECENLTSLTLPSSVETMEVAAGTFPEALKSLTMQGKAPSLVDQNGLPTDDGCSLLAGGHSLETIFVRGDFADDWFEAKYGDNPGNHLERWFSDNGLQDFWPDRVSVFGAGIIPLIGNDVSSDTVNAAIRNAEFTNAVAVTDAIGGSATNYLALKTWAQTVPGGEAAVVASDYAAVSYLLGAEALFENEPEIRIAALSLAQGTGNREQGIGNAISVTVVVKDGGEIALVDEEKVASMFEVTSDLGDWDGAAKLMPSVTNATRNLDGTMTFTVAPGDGTATSEFLRIKVK